MNNVKSNNLPYLIVGQGIAGTLLAYFLLQKKQPFEVIDKLLPGASSRVAAGIINPITGRRMAKSWRFEKLSEFAKVTYLDMGEMLGIDIFKERNILRALPTVFEQNEWDRRSYFPENRNYFCEIPNLGNYLGAVSTNNFGELRGSSKVEFKQLLVAFRELLIAKGLLHEEQFDFEKIELFNGSVFFNGKEFRKIIFCEGAKATSNPYFKYLPFSPTKGELLMVKIKGLKAEKMLKNKIYIVPLGNETFWVGATSRFEYDTVTPTTCKKDYLKNTLSDILTIPFEIISHEAGIRSTVSDKRPFLGLHSKYKCLAIFNGLGTKGASLGPYFANQMVGYLLGEINLDNEVDIKRFGH